MKTLKERTEEDFHSVEKEDIDDSKDNLGEIHEADVENCSSESKDELKI